MQAYTKLYWKKKVEAVVEERWKEECPTEVGTRPGIAFRNRVVKELFDNESAAVKDEVKAYRDETGDETEESNGENDEAATNKKHLSAMQR